MSRKSHFIILFLCLFLISGCPENILVEKALKIHESALTVDTHVDTPLFIYYLDLDLGEDHDPYAINRKVDFPRMEQGGLDAIAGQNPGPGVVADPYAAQVELDGAPGFGLELGLDLVQIAA